MKTNKWNTFVENKPYITALLIILFILIIYLPALDVYLMRDDFEWLEESYRAWQYPSILLQPINNFFRPLVKLSYLLDYTLFKTHVPYYNLTTIFIHLVNVFLLYLFIRRTTKRRYLAGLIALTFGTSPMYSEVTLWAAGRPDSILLMFILGVLLRFASSEEKKRSGPLQLGITLLLTICALASKESWVLLPFFALSFLWIMKEVPFMTAVKKTSGLFVLLILYLGYFIGLPILSGTSAPTSYAGLNIIEGVEKFEHLILKYIGMDDILTVGTRHIVPLIIIVLILAALAYRFFRTGNRVALWGLIWMLMSIAISLFIRYAPSRYNYFPLMGFWIMIAAFLDFEINRLMEKLKIRKQPILLVTGIVLFLLVSYHVIMLQWEIKDYRDQGEPHRMVIEMYNDVKDRLPRNMPIVFVDASTRKAVLESAQSVRGYRKLLFVRERAIWQMVFICPLANFAGNPFTELMEPIPTDQLDGVFQGDFTVLVFTDTAFYIKNDEKPRLREFFQEHKKLPYKVEAVRFVKAGEET
jgi:hypothetical protein